MWMFPSGWIQVICGPGPNSVVWPSHKGQRSRSSFVSLRRSLLRKRRLEEFLQWENEDRHHPSRGVNASQPVAGGHQQFGRRRRRSQEGMGVVSCQSTETGGGPTHTRQIEETREFIARARKKTLHADEKIHLAEQALAEAKEEKEYDLQELPLAESRLEPAGRGTSPCVPCSATPRPDWGAQISSLMQQVNQLQERLFRSDLTQQRVAQGEEMPAKKFRRKDFVPGCVEELSGWVVVNRK